MKFAGLKFIEMKTFRDERGSFTKPFNTETFRELGIETLFKEDFYSVSNRGVIRGMHFQRPPHDHSKLVYCSRGVVLDVAVDLRVGSPSYGECFTVELSDSNSRAIFIPAGMAHGFAALTADATVHYKVSTIHSPSHDAGILWSSIDIDWRSALGSGVEIRTSDRDRNFPELKDFVSPFRFHAGSE